MNNYEKKLFFKNLRYIGYLKLSNKSSKNHENNLVKAFQRKFRQSLINGTIDKECLLISENLSKNIK